MIVPVYRPEVTVYRRAPDGAWEPTHGGTITDTLFRPLPDDDGSAPTEAGFRRVVRLGTEPFFRIVAPEGSALVEVGRSLALQLPGGKRHDAFTALVWAKTRQMGLDLVRGPAPSPVAPSPTPPLPPMPPPPARPKGPARQLSMFDMEAIA